MEGTERLILLKPDGNRQNALGQQKDSYKQVKVYARRQDRGGREATYGDTKAGIWQVRFEIRATPSLQSVSEDWVLVDQYGIEHDLESVSFAPYWGGRKFLWLYAIRTKTRDKKWQ